MAKKVYVKLEADTASFTKGITQARKFFKRSARDLKRIGKNMSMSVTAPLTAFAGASIAAFDKQAKAEAKLRTALNGNKKAFESLTAQARELQKITLFGDEETMAAQSMLASMGLEEEAIKRLTPLIQDMATAKGMNLTAAADLVAKSVGSSTNALSRYGIQIEGAVGSTDRLDSAVDALSKQFDGQSEAAAKAGAGGLKQLQNRFGDLMENIGEMLIPVLNHLLDAVNFVIDTWNGLDEALKIVIITIGGIMASIGPAIALFGTLASVVGFVLSPMGAVVIALAALAAGVIYVVDNFKVFGQIGRMIAVSLGNAFLEIGKMLITPFELIITGFNKVRKLMGKDVIENPFSNVKQSLTDMQGEVPKVTEKFGSFSDAIVNSADKVKNALFGMGTGLGIGGSTGSEGGSSGGGSTEGSSEGSSEGGGTIVTTLSAMEQQMVALKESAVEFGVAMADNFAGSMASAVVAGQGFFKSMKQIFIDLLKQIAALIVKAAILAALFAMIPGLGAAAGGATNFTGLLTQGLTGKASGGSVVAGQPYMVGELGPELFMPGQSGTIIPNNNSSSNKLHGSFSVSGSDLVLAINNQISEETNGAGASLIDNSLK